MALNRKEANMLERYIKAAHAARAYLEPHPSWQRDRLRAEALTALEEACGGSPGLDHLYQEARQVSAKGGQHE